MIEIDSVYKHLRGVTVLSDVNLTIKRGDVVGVKGPNGSGKTMLLRLIAGLIYPSSGTIAIKGEPLDRGAFPESLGLLIENPVFLPGKTGYDNLVLLASIRGVTSEESVRSWIEKFGLDPTDKRPFRKYSLGMKQRLGLAAAFMEEPDIVLLDEPTNALDSSGVMLFSRVVREQQCRGAALVIVSHDDQLLESGCTRIAEMTEGGFLREGLA